MRKNRVTRRRNSSSLLSNLTPLDETYLLLSAAGEAEHIAFFCNPGESLYPFCLWEILRVTLYPRARYGSRLHKHVPLVDRCHGVSVSVVSHELKKKGSSRVSGNLSLREITSENHEVAIQSRKITVLFGIFLRSIGRSSRSRSVS